MATKKLGTTLQAINAQITALQAKAEAIRRKEISTVVAGIKDAIAHYGLTAADLGLISAAPKAANALKPGKLRRKPGRKVAGAVNKPKTARAAKYTDGKGHTWGGMGKRPDWFKAALAAGKTPEQLLVKA